MMRHFVFLFLSLLAVILVNSAEAAFEVEDQLPKLDADNVVDKKASNLGSRMCRLDSRNCGQFSMGKKFGRSPWVNSMDSKRRRFEYYLANRLQRENELDAVVKDYARSLADLTEEQ